MGEGCFFFPVCDDIYCLDLAAEVMVSHHLLQAQLFTILLLLANVILTKATVEGDWQKYIRSPKTQVVNPIRILSNYTQGNVTNPEGLLKPGQGPTILTRTAPQNMTWTVGAKALDGTPALVVDFGQNVAGYLSIKFAGATNSTPGFVGIRLAFSETIQVRFSSSCLCYPLRNESMFRKV